MVLVQDKITGSLKILGEILGEMLVIFG